MLIQLNVSIQMYNIPMSYIFVYKVNKITFIIVLCRAESIRRLKYNFIIFVNYKKKF